MDKKSAAMSGQNPHALDDTAASWEEITDRCGRDRVLNMYQEIGYGQKKSFSGSYIYCRIRIYT